MKRLQLKFRPHVQQVCSRITKMTLSCTYHKVPLKWLTHTRNHGNYTRRRRPLMWLTKSWYHSRMSKRRTLHKSKSLKPQKPTLHQNMGRRHQQRPSRVQVEGWQAVYWGGQKRWCPWKNWNHEKWADKFVPPAESCKPTIDAHHSQDAQGNCHARQFNQLLWWYV